MTQRIAVLLTVYNRKEKTLRCLRELFKQPIPTGYNVDVYLTNDGCTDGTPDAVRAEYPQVKIIEGDGSLFWNRGMHAAWVEAAKEEYDFYLWLNDDTFIYENCISRLLEDSKFNNDCAIIVGSTCAENNTGKITYGGWNNGNLITDVSKPQKCDAINGNIVLIPKKVYDILGTNDPKFRHALGDTDYGLRAKESNIPCLTGIGVFGKCDQHERPTTWKDPSQPFKKRWKSFMSPVGISPFEFFYFKRKHSGLISACVYFCSNWCHFLFPQLWGKCYKGFNE